MPQRPYRQFMSKTWSANAAFAHPHQFANQNVSNSPGERQNIVTEDSTTQSTSVVVTVASIVSNSCDDCGASIANPQHRFCGKCIKNHPAKSAPKANDAAQTAPAAPAVVAAPAVPPPAPPVVEIAPAVEAPKAETVPVATPAAKPAPERPAHVVVKSCKCGQKFVPRDPRHDACPKCHRAVMIARRAEEAKREADRKVADSERNAKTELLKAYREKRLPEGAKVTENGAQIVIVIDGVSTTLYDHAGFNARREAARAAEAAKAKAAVDKARADAEKAAAEKARRDRIGKALFRTYSSGKALPATVSAKRNGVHVIFTVSVVGQATATYTAVDPELAAAEDAARKATEALAKAARKAEQKKGGKGSKKAA